MTLASQRLEAPGKPGCFKHNQAKLPDRKQRRDNLILLRASDLSERWWEIGSLETARSQLKAVFRKTGAPSQNDLIRLAVKANPPIRGNTPNQGQD